MIKIDYLINERKAKNITQYELAKVLGYKERNGYWRIEKGYTRLTLEDFFIICQKLDLEPSKAISEIERSNRNDIRK